MHFSPRAFGRPDRDRGNKKMTAKNGVPSSEGFVGNENWQKGFSSLQLIAESNIYYVIQYCQWLKQHRNPKTWGDANSLKIPF